MDTKILLVEDDADLGMALKQYLESSGFEVTWHTNPKVLLENHDTLQNNQLAILDVMLPEMDGFTLAKTIRKQHEIPFLFLTAKGQSIDRILGLKLGADDYITKPCEPEELLLRIHNILKRQTSPIPNKSIRLGEYSFNPALYQLVFNDLVIQLTEKEAELLTLFLNHNHQIVNRRDILEKLWGKDDYFLGRSLDVFMTRLRKYFQHDPRISFDSIRGVGFKIEFPA
ncbi:response regulator transcription factor [Pedobacter nanyangensis]|uniref:response regulator transcription factor n=1 Tax=Pedobacter nanyangensis TaxID=1562389 RepID=UPI000DE2E3B5|nr:response regulator transcription factor [Pedobacter nanyangensis]